MDPYITGQIIRTLREKNKMTQAELALNLSVSDKTISKWETGKGYPDITLLDRLSQVLNISMTELLLGLKIDNQNISANMLKTHFYVCPVCGNVIHSTGGAMISCHGITLPALESEEITDDMIELNLVEDEYFIKIKHPMTKIHYISYIAAVSSDRVQFVKLYPEGEASARFKTSGVKYLYYYCNQDGLFVKKLKKTTKKGQ